MTRVVVIGAVSSTERTLTGLIRNGMSVVGVLGLKKPERAIVSGYKDLKIISDKNNIPFKYFNHINDQDNFEWLKNLKPDLIFAVGFSQLVGNKILNLPTKGCIGFHPTCLPKGRGRAPLAWLILEESEGAASFFKMGEGADDGPIFAQEKFTVGDDDYASDIQLKILDAIDIALDGWLPKLKLGHWDPEVQDESLAYYYGKRAPSDGKIEWLNAAKDIYRLVRASSAPYPGAFSYLGALKIKILRAKVIDNLNHKGTIGSVVAMINDAPVIQCGENHLLLEDYSFVDFAERIVEHQPPLKVGQKLGYDTDEYIFKLLNNANQS